jgi:hypothetical protein
MISLSSSIRRLEAENAVLRHQLIVLQRRVRGGVHLTNGDRLLLVQLYRWFQPKTHVSAYKAAQGQGKPSFNPFARKT